MVHNTHMNVHDKVSNMRLKMRTLVVAAAMSATVALGATKQLWTKLAQKLLIWRAMWTSCALASAPALHVQTRPAADSTAVLRCKRHR